MNKEKLEKELEEIDEEIEKKGVEINKSSEYKSLMDKRSKLWKETAEKQRELVKVRKKIYEKYIKNYRYYRYIDIKRIKSSVKEGIKRGLGVKYINLIYEFDIVKIVEQLVKEDLEKTNEKELLSDISKIDKKIRKSIERERILKNGERGERDTLIEKRKRIENRLNKKELDKEKIKEKKRGEVGKIVKNDLPKIIGKIRREVERGLLLDALED